MESILTSLSNHPILTGLFIACVIVSSCVRININYNVKEK